ncbi:MAG: hypothetical protein K2L60_07890 [Bacteroides sp.]|nr:hypothetical protein [Bacteroides sp.]
MMPPACHVAASRGHCRYRPVAESLYSPCKVTVHLLQRHCKEVAATLQASVQQLCNKLAETLQQACSVTAKGMHCFCSLILLTDTPLPVCLNMLMEEQTPLPCPAGCLCKALHGPRDR